jgi:hypothetical protein
MFPHQKVGGMNRVPEVVGIRVVLAAFCRGTASLAAVREAFAGILTHQPARKSAMAR